MQSMTFKVKKMIVPSRCLLGFWLGAELNGGGPAGHGSGLAAAGFVAKGPVDLGSSRSQVALGNALVTEAGLLLAMI